MPHFDTLYPGRFLKGVTLAQPKTIRIKELVGEMLESGDDEENQKPNKPKAILRYVAKDGPGEMVLCKTNALLISAMYGPDYAGWTDKLVTLHFDDSVRFGRTKPGGIRVLGSPDLTRSMNVEIKRPRRKKPEVYTLQPTAPTRRGSGDTAAETPAARFYRLMNEAQSIEELDRVLADAQATLKGADLNSAENYAQDRRAALAA